MLEHPNDLVITLTLKAKRADLYRCGTEADLLDTLALTLTGR